MLTHIIRPQVQGDPLTSFSREVDRLFNTFAATPAEPGNGKAALVPAMNLYREGDALVAEFDLPGFTPACVDVRVQDDTLTVSGTREVRRPDAKRSLRIERVGGRFERTIGLPFPVDQEGVEASLEDGVLRVVLPQAESAKPRRIAVSDGRRLEAAASENVAENENVGEVSKPSSEEGAAC